MLFKKGGLLFVRKRARARNGMSIPGTVDIEVADIFYNVGRSERSIHDAFYMDQM